MKKREKCTRRRSGLRPLRAARHRDRVERGESSEPQRALEGHWRGLNYWLPWTHTRQARPVWLYLGPVWWPGRTESGPFGDLAHPPA